MGRYCASCVMAACIQLGQNVAADMYLLLLYVDREAPSYGAAVLFRTAGRDKMNDNDTISPPRLHFGAYRMIHMVHRFNEP